MYNFGLNYERIMHVYSNLRKWSDAVVIVVMPCPEVRGREN
jgi:hypothetical protein